MLTDVHNEIEVPAAAQVVDVLQTPAFLARQTDFISAVARSGKAVNIKKAQNVYKNILGPTHTKVIQCESLALILNDYGNLMT